MVTRSYVTTSLSRDKMMKVYYSHATVTYNIYNYAGMIKILLGWYNATTIVDVQYSTFKPSVEQNNPNVYPLPELFGR